jgi:hypothetical protein
MTNKQIALIIVALNMMLEDAALSDEARGEVVTLLDKLKTVTITKSQLRAAFTEARLKNAYEIAYEQLEKELFK